MLILIYALFLITINNSGMQKWMGKECAALLSEKTGSEVTIEKAKLGLFNRVDLEGVRINDLQKQSLLRAGQVSAKIAWRPLLSGKVRLRSVALMDGNIRLYKSRKDSAGNWQFFLDAFKSKEGGPSTLDLVVGSVIVRRIGVSYDELDSEPKRDRIDPKHLAIRKMDASISLKQLTNDAVRLRIRHLALEEKSGLRIDELSGKIVADKRQANVKDLNLRLPHSRLHLDDWTVTYDLSRDASLLSTLQTHLVLNKAAVSTSDWVFALPQLKGADYDFLLSADVSWRPARLHVNRLDLQEADGNIDVLGSADIAFKGKALSDVSATIERLSIKNAFLQDIPRRFVKADIPKVPAFVGDVDMNGIVSVTTGQGQNHFKGKVASGIGAIDGDVTWKGKVFRGTLKAGHLMVAKLFPDKELPNDISASLSGEADLTTPSAPSLKGKVDVAQVTFRNYTYRDIHAEGHLQNRQAALTFASTDPDLNMKGEVKADFSGKELRNVYVSADVNRLVLGRVGVTGSNAQTALTGLIRANLPAASLAHPSGEVSLQNFALTHTSRPVQISRLHVNATPSARGTRIDAATDFAEVHFDGPTSFASLKKTIRILANRVLNNNAAMSEGTTDNSEWIVNATIYNDDLLQQFAKLPVHIVAPLTLRGNVRTDGGHMALTATTDSLAVGGTTLYDLSAYVGGDDINLYSVVQGRTQLGKNMARFALDMRTSDEGLRSSLKWDAGADHFFNGELKLLSSIETVDNKVQSFRTQIEPSHVYIGDDTWNISRGDLFYGQKKLQVDNFSIDHGDQKLSIDGSISQEEGGTIVANLNKVAVEYILGLVNFHAVDFAGLATGKAYLKLQDNVPCIEANLTIPQFKINNEQMGLLHLLGNFNTSEKQINLNGLIDNVDAGQTAVNGYVNLSRKDLNLDISGEHTSLNFLSRYVGGIFRDFKGDASGHCRLFGPLKQLDLEGTEMGNAEAEVIATGAKYRLSDGMVSITPGDFFFQSFNIKDLHNGSGMVSGHLLHENLKNIRYNFSAAVNNLLVYNQGKSVDMPFYSTAYGTGRISLQGYPGSFEADMDIRPERGTTLTYIVNTPETFGENAFVTFHDKNAKDDSDDLSENTTNDDEDKTSATDIRLNMLIETNPNATVNIVMDEKTGDNISLHGSGPLRANFYNKGHFNLYGTYTIEDGIYNLSISDIIRKDFHLTKGGTLNFAGNPYQGNLDMQAVYTVNSASLSDLNLTGSFSQNSVKVNCLLNFSGKVLNPQVNFDLDLPSLGEDEKQMVRNLISTEEDMNMQIIYLLGFGRFYSYNYASAGTSTTAGEQSAAAMKSFLSSTLSSQLNNIISNAMDTHNWSIGANVSTGSLGTNEMEVDGILSGRLFNNRLLVNGNFGYRDNSVYNNNFIGDFDVQYLLTPGGSVSLKAYSETNDRYFTKSSLTTQGVGILLRRDFSNFRELFSKKRSAVGTKRTKKRKK